MMRRKAGLYWVGSGIALSGLLALAGCGGGIMQFGAERAAWRHDAEAACMKSGAIKENAGVVQISPIEGPGMCGADFPLKVAALGVGSVAMSYGDQVRPPGAVPSASMPRWPVNDSYYPPSTRAVSPPQELGAPPRDLNAQARDLEQQRRDVGAPMRITPGIDDYVMRSPAPQSSYPPPQPSRYAPPPYEAPRTIAPRYVPQPRQQEEEPAADDIPDDAMLPDRHKAPPSRQSARPLSPSPRYEPPKLGPARPVDVSQVKATVSPPATLACPMVTALDKWVSESVQPAAMKWFRQPVVEIKQISSYSCRGMVGGGHHISEHAFGNALDVAGFTLADGRKVLVKTGWHGRPEEAGFLHDVQGAACDVFSTVLAPGYNRYHYDHIHVDLMRRASGRTPCRPTPIPGEVAAARQLQKSKYAHRGGRDVTGSIGRKAGEAIAVAGEDGEFDDED
jgi:hypothetical protein